MMNSNMVGTDSAAGGQKQSSGVVDDTIPNGDVRLHTRSRKRKHR